MLHNIMSTFASFDRPHISVKITGTQNFLVDTFSTQYTLDRKKKKNVSKETNFFRNKVPLEISIFIGIFEKTAKSTTLVLKDVGVGMYVYMHYVTYGFIL